MKPDLSSWLGKAVLVQIDRPIHSYHPERPTLRYEVNYGFIDGTISGDLECIDAYVLGVDEPLEIFEGVVIAVLIRADDIEDKLVVAAWNSTLSDTEIMRLVSFQESYFRTTVMRHG